jgi:carboxyl-terminal processing protease
MNNKKTKYFIFAAIVVVFSVGSFAFGAYASQKQIIKFKFIPVQSVEAATKTSTNTDLFFTVWNTLKEKSIHYNDVTDEERMYGAIKGLTASLGDPYTEFMPPAQSKKFNESISGSFDGIGAEIGKSEDDILTVIAPLKGSPAEKSGLKSGDKVLKIDGVITNDMSIDESISKIRGKKGTVVNLEIYRKGDIESKTISITRDTIVVPTVETEIIQGVFVIRISSFGEKAMSDFEKAINEYKKSGLNYMVIDVRGNPGGYLEAAVDISSYFIPKGKTVVIEDYVKNNKKKSILVTVITIF